MTNEIYIIYEAEGQFSEYFEEPLFFVSSKKEAIQTIQLLDRYSEWLYKTKISIIESLSQWKKKNPQPKQEKRWVWIDAKLLANDDQYQEYCEKSKEWTKTYFDAEESLKKKVNVPNEFALIHAINDRLSLDDLYYEPRFFFRPIEEKHILKDSNEQD